MSRFNSVLLTTAVLVAMFGSGVVCDRKLTYDDYCAIGSGPPPGTPYVCMHSKDGPPQWNARGLVGAYILKDRKDATKFVVDLGSITGYADFWTRSNNIRVQGQGEGCVEYTITKMQHFDRPQTDDYTSGSSCGEKVVTISP